MSASTWVAIVVIAGAALAAAAAQAQGASPRTAAPVGLRDPGDPAASVPPVTYASAFRRYRPNAETDVGAWRDLNDHVGRIGGWRIYGREASAEAPAPPAKPASGTKPDGPSSPPAHGHRH